MKPLISVIVPCYNQGQYLSAALDSVLSQSYENWECIIVDDGSTDETNLISKKYCLLDKRIKYVYHSNSGLAATRNAGIKQSLGKYILPLDADDKIGSKYMEIAVSYLEEHPSCKLCYCRASLFGAMDGLLELPEYSYNALRYNNLIFCSAIYRRTDYDRTIGYNPNMVWGLEDWDFWLSLLSEQDEVYQIEQVLFYYRIKRVSMLTGVHEHRSDMLRQIMKNHPDVYSNILDDLFTMRDEYIKRIDTIYDSFSYRLGHSLIWPIRVIRRLLFRKTL